MKKTVEKQLRQAVDLLKKGAEERDEAAIREAFDPMGLVNAFGEFLDIEELAQSVAELKDGAEEVSISIGNLTRFKETENTVSATLPVEVSFVETGSWQLKRFRVNVGLRFGRDGETWRLGNLALSDLVDLGGRFGPGGIGDLGGISKEEPAEFMSPFGAAAWRMAAAPAMPQAMAQPMPMPQPMPAPMMATPGGPVMLTPAPWPQPMPQPWPQPMPQPWPWPMPMPSPWPPGWPPGGWPGLGGISG